MTAFKVCLMLTSAFLLVGCQTSAPASVCDGWSDLNPSAQTRQFIIAQDRTFAVEVGAHNEFGRSQGCWE